jgi:hypothetical protein
MTCGIIYPKTVSFKRKVVYAASYFDKPA